MTRRGWMLAGLALVVLVNWGYHRVRPRLAEVRRLGAERERLAAEADAPGAPLGPLTAEVDGLDAEVERLEAALAALDGRAAGADEVADLQVRLAALAEAAGLRLEAQDPLVIAAPEGPRLEGDVRRVAQEKEAPPSRTARWRLRGEFGALWTFLARLDELPTRVVVSNLSLERPQDGPDDAPLVIRLEVTL
ncbi:MAG: hypothetical protein M9894_39980 [Planctomycetes bacterium]|nr:hypothetical protein [Planctomycetota bacterium]